jgi:muconolactone delta-isomerase
MIVVSRNLFIAGASKSSVKPKLSVVPTPSFRDAVTFRARSAATGRLANRTRQQPLYRTLCDWRSFGIFGVNGH